MLESHPLNAYHSQYLDRRQVTVDDQGHDLVLRQCQLLLDEAQREEPLLGRSAPPCLRWPRHVLGVVRRLLHTRAPSVDGTRRTSFGSQCQQERRCRTQASVRGVCPAHPNACCAAGAGLATAPSISCAAGRQARAPTELYLIGTRTSGAPSACRTESGAGRSGPGARARAVGVTEPLLRLVTNSSLGGRVPLLLCQAAGDCGSNGVSARHAGLRSGGMGTVSDDIGPCESTQA